MTPWDEIRIRMNASLYPNDKLVQSKLMDLYKEIDRRNKKMLNVKTFAEIEHDFTTTMDQTCAKCGTSVYEVQSGSGSWVCSAKEMPCCGKEGYNRWDSHNSQWNCSACASVTSNDPNYTSGGPIESQDSQYGNFDYVPNVWGAPVITKPEPKKCDCHINTLMSGGCCCGGI